MYNSIKSYKTIIDDYRLKAFDNRIFDAMLNHRYKLYIYDTTTHLSACKGFLEYYKRYLPNPIPGLPPMESELVTYPSGQLRRISDFDFKKTLSEYRDKQKDTIKKITDRRIVDE